MVKTILTVLLLATSNFVSMEPIESTTELASNVTDTQATVIEKHDTQKGQLAFEKLNKTIQQEIRDIISTLDKNYHDRKGVSLFNSSQSADNGYKVVLVGSRGGFPSPQEEFHYYSQPPTYEYPEYPAEHKYFNAFHPQENRRGSFAIYERVAPGQQGLSVRQVLEGPINVAIPLRNREMAVYFVNRGLKSLKWTPSLRPVNEALSRLVRKMGLTIPAAFSIRSRYLSWPVKSVVYADPVFLTDISNAGTYPTILFVPEDDVELTRMTPDIVRIADFSLLEEGIRYVLPSHKQLL